MVVRMGGNEKAGDSQGNTSQGDLLEVNSSLPGGRSGVARKAT